MKIKDYSSRPLIVHRTVFQRLNAHAGWLLLQLWRWGGYPTYHVSNGHYVTETIASVLDYANLELAVDELAGVLDELVTAGFVTWQPYQQHEPGGVIEMIKFGCILQPEDEPVARRQAVRAGLVGPPPDEAEYWLICQAFGGRCVACGVGRDDLIMDHVIPLAWGGSNALTNLQPLCPPCNLRKGAKQIDYRGRYGYPYPVERSDNRNGLEEYRR